MDCRKTSAHKFRTKLGFKQYDFILTKAESVLTKAMSSFQGDANKNTNMFQVIELIYFSMRINSQQKLMKMVIVTEIYIMN